MKTEPRYQYLVDNKGRRRAVVIDAEAYNQLMEDLSDLKVVAERKANPKFSSARFVARLKKNGIL